MIDLLFSLLIFPGLLFVLVAGLMAGSLKRAVSERMVWQRHIPLLQPLSDLRKLFNKEMLIPGQVKKPGYIAFPALTFLSLLFGCILIFRNNLVPESG